MMNQASELKRNMTSKWERLSYSSYSFGQNLMYMLQL